MAAALNELGIEATPRGTSDLAVGERKISGNSLRRKRDWILYHGTILYGLSMPLISDCLLVAPRQPAYRRGRSHADFVAHVPLPVDELKRVIARAWQAQGELGRIPYEQMRELVVQRYGTNEWNRGR
jgi:lipoate-protein ligase A